MSTTLTETRPTRAVVRKRVPFRTPYLSACGFQCRGHRRARTRRPAAHGPRRTGDRRAAAGESGGRAGRPDRHPVCRNGGRPMTPPGTAGDRHRRAGRLLGLSMGTAISVPLVAARRRPTAGSRPCRRSGRCEGRRHGPPAVWAASAGWWRCRRGAGRRRYRRPARLPASARMLPGPNRVLPDPPPPITSRTGLPDGSRHRLASCSSTGLRPRIGTSPCSGRSNIDSGGRNRQLTGRQAGAGARRPTGGGGP